MTRPSEPEDALSQAYRDYYAWDREEQRLFGEAYAAGNKRIEAAARVQELGGRL